MRDRLAGLARRLSARPALAAAEAGSVMVEFALVVPVLLLALLGGITYAGVLNVFLTSNHAVAEVARALTAAQDSTDRRTIFNLETGRVKAMFRSPSCATFVLTDLTGESTVTVTYNYATDACRLTPAFPLIPIPSQLAARSTVLRGG